MKHIHHFSFFHCLTLAALGLPAVAPAQAQTLGGPLRQPPQGHKRMVHFRHQPGVHADNATPQCKSPLLSYFDGPILSSVDVVTVNWNSNVNPLTSGNMPQFYQDLTGSAFFAAIGEYSTAGIPGGSDQELGFGSSHNLTGYTITPAICPASKTSPCIVTDAQLQTELQNQIKNGALPPAAVDSLGFTTTYYSVHFPPNVIVQDPSFAQSCNDFCSYHNTGGTIANPLVYGVLPDTFTTACSACGKTPMSAMTTDAAHELTEAVTDALIGLDTNLQVAFAYPAGWGDNDNDCGEVEDICDDGTEDPFTVSGRTWFVNEFWSNRLGECISSAPARTSVPITWATPSAITYPTSLSGAQLDASTTVAGTFAYAPPSGAVLTAGLQTLNTVFTPNDISDYLSSNASVTLQVNQGTPVLSWTPPAPVNYPTALSSTQLDASANVPGTFVYTPAVGAVPLPGPQTLGVQFTPTDATDYKSVSSSVTLQVIGGAIGGPAVVSYRVLFGTQAYNLATSTRNRLPWQITGLQVVFSEAIATATAGSLGGFSATSVSGLGTNTVTWTFNPLPLGNYTAMLASSGANAIMDAGGNVAVTTGLPLSQTFKVLPGDVNDDGAVTAVDLAMANGARVVGPYNLFADLNGDGAVNTLDVTILRGFLGTSLP